MVLVGLKMVLLGLDMVLVRNRADCAGETGDGAVVSSYAKLGRLMGMGKIMVELCSAEMELRVWRYLSCSAWGDWWITVAASLRARDAFCSPSAAITFALASLAASASVAMAL